MDKKELNRIFYNSTRFRRNKSERRKDLFVYLFVPAIYLLFAILAVSLGTVLSNVNGRDLNNVFSCGGTLVLALMITAIYCFNFKKKSYGTIGYYISVCIVCVGYFAISLSTELSEALLANKIAFLGNCFIPLSLLAIILETCKIKYNKNIFYILIAISIVAFILTLTIGYSDAFYKNMDFSNDRGTVVLKVECGPAYIAYIVYVGVYYALSVACLIYSIMKKHFCPKDNAFLVVNIILPNIICWIMDIIATNALFMVDVYSTPYMTITSASYIMLSMDELSHNNSFHRFPSYDEWKLSRKAHDSYTITDEFGDYNALADLDMDFDNKTISVRQDIEYLSEIDFSRYSDEQLREFLSKLDGWKSLSKTEKTIAVFLLKDVKRSDIAIAMDRTEDTIKTHTSHIYKKLGVENRKVLSSAVTEKMHEHKII